MLIINKIKDHIIFFVPNLINQEHTPFFLLFFYTYLSQTL